MKSMLKMSKGGKDQFELDAIHNTATQPYFPNYHTKHGTLIARPEADPLPPTAQHTQRVNRFFPTLKQTENKETDSKLLTRN